TALGAVDLASVDGEPTGTAISWLCISWLALHEGRLDDARADLRRAIGDMTEHYAGPHAAQRIFGPALALAAWRALAEGGAGRAVTLLHAATAVLTLRGTVPERPQVRWARRVDAQARELLDAGGYAAAAERGTRIRLAEALRYADLPAPSSASAAG